MCIYFYFGNFLYELIICLLKVKKYGKKDLYHGTKFKYVTIIKMPLLSIVNREK